MSGTENSQIIMNAIDDRDDHTRILVVDDNRAIHEDFRKVLQYAEDDELGALEEFLFDEQRRPAGLPKYQIDSEFQGEEAFYTVVRARRIGAPYALAFVDMRMPPGWDGLRTVEEILAADLEIQCVICTAYSDHSWQEIHERVGASDRLLILKKPFDEAEVCQIAMAMTEKWKLARLARMSLDRLQHEVVTRTDQLVKTQVEMAAAKEADRAKSEFLANMSHELRTPMHGILSFAELGEQKIDTVERSKLASYFNRICRSAKRMMDLLDSLLDLTRLESGLARLDLTQARMRALIATVVDELESIAGDRGIEFEFESTSDTQLEIDVTKIMQVVRNVLGNSIKFADENSIIRIDMKETDARVRITISDHGPGIPDNELMTVFCKFQQSSRTKTGAGGTGLGLPISRELVELHGGAIWADNSDYGAVFHIELPLEIRPAATAERGVPG